MKRVLLTGISGVGKSAVTVGLQTLGYAAVDVDNEDYSEWVEVASGSDEYGSTVEPNRDWVWQADRIQELLSKNDADLLFVSGCAANMGQFLYQFDHVVLLSAPKELILERLRSRINNNYGKHPEEATRVLELKDSVEPILRKIATHEINTSAGMEFVLSEVLRIAMSSLAQATKEQSNRMSQTPTQKVTASKSAKTENRVTVRNPNTPDRTSTVDAVKYNAMKGALLQVLPHQSPGLTQAEMFEAVLPHLPAEVFPGGEKAGWWVKCVQLDLEVQSIIVRETSKPLRWHQA